MILGPLGYGPSTLPLRHSAENASKEEINNSAAKNIVKTVYLISIRCENFATKEILEKSFKSDYGLFFLRGITLYFPLGALGSFCVKAKGT